MTTIRVTAPEDLPEIIDLVHDRSFYLKAVVIDLEAREVRVPVLDRQPGSGRLRRLLTGAAEIEATATSELVIRRVLRCSIDDGAGIGSSTFNVLRYDATARRLSIECNVPLVIVATVEDLDVTVTTL